MGISAISHVRYDLSIFKQPSVITSWTKYRHIYTIQIYTVHLAIADATDRNSPAVRAQQTIGSTW